VVAVTLPAHLLALLLQFLPLHSKSGLATIYWPGDRHCGTEKADGSRFRKSDSHIAHRRLPLGTEGLLCSVRSGRCTWTVVQDRGPFGAVKPCGLAADEVGRKIKWRGRCHRWQSQPGRLRPGWAFRGEFDLTVPVARAIGHHAFDRVVFYYLPKRFASKRLTS
jgi:hypothetical protein